MSNNKIKTFPLTVTQAWLDKIEKAKKHYESKHEYIIRAVDEKVKFDSTGSDVIYDRKEDK